MVLNIGYKCFALSNYRLRLALQMEMAHGEVMKIVRSTAALQQEYVGVVLEHQSRH